MNSKLNNQQRKNLCNLVDEKAKASVANVDTGDDNILRIVSNRLKKHNTYSSLQKVWDVLEKKLIKKRVDVDAKIMKLKDELGVISNEREKVQKAIESIGLKPGTGIAIHDKKWIGRNYRDPTYKTMMYGENYQVWKGVEADLQEEKNNILQSAVTTKEKIWLAETREEAEQLIKE